LGGLGIWSKRLACSRDFIEQNLIIDIQVNSDLHNPFRIMQAIFLFFFSGYESTARDALK